MADLRAPIATQKEISYNARATGLTPGYRLEDNEGNVVVGPTQAGVAELGTSGVYAASILVPASVGDWTLIWSKDFSFDPSTNSIDMLSTFDPGDEPVTMPDLAPTSPDGISSTGPCQAWATEDEVWEFCEGEAAGSDPSVYAEAVVVASQLLYQMSARRFSGTCTRSVRPCRGSCGDVWPWPYSEFTWAGDFWRDATGAARGCGCTPLDAIQLAGSARSIEEVLIDGQIVDPTSYRLDERRRLVRMRDSEGERQFWPGCQHDDAEPTEDGTFEVTYNYGLDPPAAGLLAARELACAIYSSTPAAALDEECVLPNGVTKIVRQGVTYELVADAGWGFIPGKGWRTGLPLVDAFLNAYNPRGRRKRRASIWSADLDRYPRPVGDPLAS